MMNIIINDSSTTVTPKKVLKKSLEVNREMTKSLDAPNFKKIADQRLSEKKAKDVPDDPDNN